MNRYKIPKLDSMLSIDNNTFSNTDSITDRCNESFQKSFVVYNTLNTDIYWNCTFSNFYLCSMEETTVDVLMRAGFCLTAVL